MMHSELYNPDGNSGSRNTFQIVQSIMHYDKRFNLEEFFKSEISFGLYNPELLFYF